eukprot:3380691-Rhodomonas_salina.2
MKRESEGRRASCHAPALLTNVLRGRGGRGRLFVVGVPAAQRRPAPHTSSQTPHTSSDLRPET